MSLEAELERGAKAEQLLANPLIAEAFDSVKAGIHDAWEGCPLRDTQGAHELRLMLKLLGDVRAVFEMAVVDGQMARDKLKEINSRVISPAQWSGR